MNTTTDIHDKATRGIRLLLLRQLFLQLLTLSGGIVLARILEPAMFGIFAIISALLSLFSLMGDFGLAPSLIQRHEEIGDRDLQIAFTLQQILTTAVVGMAFIAAPFVLQYYPSAPHESIWLIRVLAFNLYLASWRAMSALQLERSLRYNQLAWIEVIEAAVYQCSLLIFALLGWGVWSFIWSVLIRGILGTLLMFRAAPWHVRFAFDATIARDLLRYGVPFQAQVLASAMGTWILPIVWGPLVGARGVGLISFASSNGRKPQLIVDNVMRVAFPHFSRIQTERDEVDHITSRYLVYLLLAAGLWFTALTTAGPFLVRWIYTAKWSAATPALILFAGGFCFETISWVLTIALNSRNLVYSTTRTIIFRSALHLLLTIPLTARFGITGAGWAYCVTYATCIPLFFVALGKGSMRQLLMPMLWLVAPVLAGITAGTAVAHLSEPLIIHSLSTGAASTIAFAACTLLVGPAWLTARCVNVSRRIVAAWLPGFHEAHGVS